MDYQYDILFLGGGLNYAGAIVASKAGLKCALVEKNVKHLGGTCLHNGCIPSKMYLQAVESIGLSKKEYFEGRLSLKMDKLYTQKEELLNKATLAITKQCSLVDIIEGEGVVIAPHTIEVSKRRVTAKYIIIGVGSSPSIPKGIEYDKKRVITSDEVFAMQNLPKEISIYGDGAIGLEMATFFALSGVETELIWRHDTLLRKAHPFISKNIKMQMEKLGVKLCSNHSIIEAKTNKDIVDITFDDGSKHSSSYLLIATGRYPNIKAIQTNQIDIDKRGIVTNSDFETSLKDHYAIGDCNGKLQLAHASRAEVLYVVQKILNKNPKKIDLSRVVKFIHTLPCSYAIVGEGRVDLEKRGVSYKESVVSLKGLPFATTHEGDDGVMVLYADEEGFVVGGEIFAPNAEELIGIVSMALAGEMDARTAKQTILAHPTFSESLEKAFRRL